MFYPLKTVSTALKYNKIDNFSEETGTSLTTKTKLWPDTETTISSIEKIPPLGLFAKDFTMTGKYSMKTVDKTGISFSTSTTWSGNWKFRIIKDLFIFKDFSTILDYSVTKGETFDIPQYKISSEGDSKKLGSSLSFRVSKKWQCIFRYDHSYSHNKTDEVSTNTRLVGRNLKTEGKIHLGLLSQPITMRAAVDVQTKTSDVEKDNYDTATGTLSGDYSVGGNFILTATTSLKRYWSHKLPQDDYISISASATLTIRF